MGDESAGVVIVIHGAEVVDEAVFFCGVGGCDGADGCVAELVGSRGDLCEADAEYVAGAGC